MLKKQLLKLRKALVLAQNANYRRGLRAGVGATIEHENAIRPLGLASLVDVGANKGQFALMAQKLFVGVVIHSFEPLEEPAAKYLRLFAGMPGIFLHNVALGENSGAIQINVSGREDSSSILAISKRQEKFYPGSGTVAQRTIAMKRGDDVLAGLDLPHPMLIKLDVQGFELSVLKGMPNLLARADYVYAEISFQELYSGQVLAPELIAFLWEVGFQLSGFYNLSVDPEGQPIQADALFKRKY